MKLMSLAIACVATVTVTAATAQDFPARPITIVVPFGPGSGTDVGTRHLAENLRASLGQPLVVENKPGASGTIASSYVAQAAADGYTLLMGTTSTHGANPALILNMPYDPVADFVPIGLVGVFEGVLAVHPSVPANSVAELIEFGRANPGQLAFATGNTSSLIMGETFTRQAGIDAVRVPYSSNPDALIDLVAGRVDMMFPDVASSLGHVRNEAIRPLATVTLDGPNPVYPDLPTVADTFEGFHTVGWIGLFAPAGTPEDAIARISAALEAGVNDQGFANRLRDLGAEATFMPASEFASFVDSEVETYSRVLPELGVEPQ